MCSSGCSRRDSRLHQLGGAGPARRAGAPDSTAWRFTIKRNNAFRRGSGSAKLFGRLVSPRLQQADFMDAVRLAASGHGVVIGLAPPTGNGESHAVRLRAGDIPVLGPFHGLPPAIRNVVFPPEVLDLIGRVQVFDPWPGQGRLSDEVQYGPLRRRFDRAGQQALVISPLPTKRWAR